MRILLRNEKFDVFRYLIIIVAAAPKEEICSIKNLHSTTLYYIIYVCVCVTVHATRVRA